MNEDTGNRAITIGRLQVEFESLYSDKGLTEKELRSELLRRCAQEGLNCNTFEYLAKYLANKICVKANDPCMSDYVGSLSIGK